MQAFAFHHRAGKVVDAAIKCVAIAPPRGANPTRNVVHFKYADTVTIHCRITTSRQATYASANDNRRLVDHARESRDNFLLMRLFGEYLL